MKLIKEAENGPGSLDRLLLRCCLTSDFKEFSDLSTIWELRIDIDQISYASLRLIPMYYGQLVRFGLDSRYIKRIKTIYKFWWLKTRFLLDQLSIISKSLHDANVESIVLKGGSICHYYEKPEYRPMSDIDLLIRFDDIPRAVSCLESAGFGYDKKRYRLMRKMPLWCKRYSHFIEFHKDDLDVLLDLHWSAGGSFTSNTAKALIRTSVPSKVLPSLKIPLISYEIMLVILHGVLSRSHDNLNWILDIQFLNKRATKEDWIKAYEAAKAEQKADHFLLGIRQLREFNLDIPGFPDKSSYITPRRRVVRAKSTEESIFQWARRMISNGWIRVNDLYPNHPLATRTFHFIQYMCFEALQSLVINSDPKKIDNKIELSPEIG